MAKVGLLVPMLVQPDAMANDVLGMYHALRGRGHDVRIFAERRGGGEVPIYPHGKMAGFLRDPDSVLIYHHAIGWALGIRLVCEARCRRIVKFHNVTPAHFYEGVNGDCVQACQTGREQVARLAWAGCDRYLADSQYNLNELTAEGADPAAGAVVPPFHKIERLHALEADLAVLREYQDGRKNILMVGRIAPNKGHAHVIDAFAVYNQEYNPDSRLILVGKGDDRTAAFHQALLARVKEHGLQEAVAFTGAVSDAALKAFYLAADVFVIASAHEGFCVPLVEAMAMKVPVVALGSSAVPETAGPTGLIWEAPDPYLFAESIHCLIAEEETRAAISAAGWRRYRKYFSNDRIESRLFQALEGVL